MNSNRDLSDTCLDDFLIMPQKKHIIFVRTKKQKCIWFILRFLRYIGKCGKCCKCCKCCKN